MKRHHLSIALLAGLSLSAASFTAQADFIGLQIGGGGWKHDPSGDFRYNSGGSSVSIDLDSDLHLQTQTQGYFYISFEHPVPLLPNVRIMSTKLENSGSGQISQDFTFNNQTYTASTSVTSTLNLNQTDLTLYWELLDNVVSLDFGLTLKKISGEATLVSTALGTSSTTFSQVIPMGYFMLGVSPMEGLLISAETNIIQYSGSTISDFTAKVSYTTDYFLGIEGGYRKQVYKLNDVSGVFGNMQFSGPFLGAYLKF
ncbi:MAG: TIGR04219 family outer membrane beta-barrel protein [Gammaproteobacteria bacterium]|nr:TIGR04219 family outer membrane beta-barrel protein [Gammaproteobacteria bacterium]